MTQAFYTKHVLPVYIQRIKELEDRYERRFYLQEDNNLSYGTRSDYNVAACLKQKNGSWTLQYSPNSPDLSPIESIWNIITARLRGGSW
jgi:transposase